MQKGLQLGSGWKRASTAENFPNHWIITDFHGFKSEQNKVYSSSLLLLYRLIWIRRCVHWILEPSRYDDLWLMYLHSQIQKNVRLHKFNRFHLQSHFYAKRICNWSKFMCIVYSENRWNAFYNSTASAIRDRAREISPNKWIETIRFTKSCHIL